VGRRAAHWKSPNQAAQQPTQRNRCANSGEDQEYPAAFVPPLMALK
jgi:hypothetical protein